MSRSNTAFTAGNAAEPASHPQALRYTVTERRFRYTSISAILGSLCLGLGIVAWMELSGPPISTSELPKAFASGLETAAEPLADFSLPPLDQFAIVRERPLFSIDRRPAARIDDSARSWSSFVLAGILIAPDERQALLLHGSPAVSVHIGEGQSLDGWTATSIQPDRVVFVNGSAEHELMFLRIASTVASAQEKTLDTQGEKVQEAGPAELVPLSRQLRSPLEPNDPNNSEAQGLGSDGMTH